MLFLFNIRMPKPEDNFVRLTAMVAVSIGSIGIDLQDIPNQPIIFTVRLYDIFIRNCESDLFFLIRLIQNNNIVLKMLLLHGHGKHLLRIQIILTFFFVCQ